MEGLESREQAHAAVWWRRVFLVALLVLVAAGATGYLGDTTATVRATGGSYELELTYASTARAGLDVPWQVTVRHPGGFTSDSLTLAVTGDYFDIYETQGFHPDPSDSTRDGSTLYLTFNAPPSGDTEVQPKGAVSAVPAISTSEDQKRMEIELSVRARIRERMSRTELANAAATGINSDKLKLVLKPVARYDAHIDYLKATPGVRAVVVSGGDVANVPWKNLEGYLTRLLGED